MSTQQMEEQIWNYIDATADAKDIFHIENMIATDATWLAKYNELLEINQLLKTGTELEQPSIRFSKNVMEQISGIMPAKATNKYINKKIIIGIAAFFLFTIAGFLIYGFATTNWNTVPESTSLQATLKKISSFELNLKRETLNILLNSFMTANVILGLVLVDFYLRKRKLSSHKR